MIASIQSSLKHFARYLLAHLLKDTEPSSVKSRAFLTFIHGDLKLKPLLLNSKDSITFRILLARSFKEMDVDIRIADVKGIRKVDTTQNQVNGLHIYRL